MGALANTKQHILRFFWLACRHRHITKPFSHPRAAANPKADWEPVGEAAPYVVCLDCGAELKYDWELMRIVS